MAKRKMTQAEREEWEADDPRIKDPAAWLRELALRGLAELDEKRRREQERRQRWERRWGRFRLRRS